MKKIDRLKKAFYKARRIKQDKIDAICGYIQVAQTKTLDDLINFIIKVEDSKTLK